MNPVILYADRICFLLTSGCQPNQVTGKARFFLLSDLQQEIMHFFQHIRRAILHSTIILTSFDPSVWVSDNIIFVF